MRKIIVVFLFLLSLSPAYAATVKIVLVGDSNTAYTSSPYGDLGSKLSTALHTLYPANTYTVYNEAVAATTSADALNNFSTQVTPFTPQIVFFLHGGTNDGYYNYMPSYNGVDYNPTAYEARVRSYKDLVNAVSTGSSQYGGHTLMFMITAPAHCESTDGCTYYRNDTDVQPIRDKMTSLAAEWNLPIVQWQTLMTEDSNWKADYLVDGVHVKSSAKDLLVTQIINELSPWLASDGTIQTLPAQGVLFGTGNAVSFGVGGSVSFR